MFNEFKSIVKKTQRIWLLDKEQSVLKEQLVWDIQLELQELVYLLCPVESKVNAFWEKKARDLIFGVALALWEDFFNGFLWEEQFNLFTVCQIIQTYCLNNFDELREYLSNRELDSKARLLSNTILIAYDKTLESILHEALNYASKIYAIHIRKKYFFDITKKNKFIKELQELEENDVK